jgi:acyl carrier protein
MKAFGRKKMEFEKIKAIIADKMDLDPDTITEQSSFKDLEMDSLDMVEIVMDVEDEFDITIETSEGLETIADLIALIRSQN